jgi:hypothetical protein
VAKVWAGCVVTWLQRYSGSEARGKIRNPKSEILNKFKLGQKGANEEKRGGIRELTRIDANSRQGGILQKGTKSAKGGGTKLSRVDG